MTGTNPIPICDVFIDESSQTGHRYLVLGGIIVPTPFAESLTLRIMDARLPQLPRGEMKWTKVSRGKLDAYKRVIDLFFSPEFEREIHFHSLAADLSKQNNAYFNEGSREIGFSKELFQLARKFGRLYQGRFHIYPDERRTDQKLEDLRLMLNRHINKTEPHRDWPYRRVQFRNSAQTPILQLADIMTGAIAFKLNGHDKADDASPAKIEMAKHILDHAGIRDISRSTSISGKFTLWHRNLKMVP